MGRRGYSAEFKAEVLAVYETEGPSEAGRRFGISRFLVGDWAAAAGKSTTANSKASFADANLANQARRERIRSKMLLRVEEMLDRLKEPSVQYVGNGAHPIEVQLPHPPANVCKDLALACAILLDKYRLEKGEPTERWEANSDEVSRKLEDKLIGLVVPTAEAITKAASHPDSS